MPEEEKINIGKEILEWIIYFVAAALVASFLQSQLYALTTVHQSSMQNTFYEGHTLIMNKLSYQYSEPKAGDIIIFLKGENTKGFLNKYKVFFKDIELRFNNSFRTNRLIKRVIAVEEIRLIFMMDKFLSTTNLLMNLMLRVLHQHGKLNIH